MKRKNDEKIRQLIAENRRLKANVRQLRYELERAHHVSPKKKPDNRIHDTFQHQAQSKQLFAKQRYSAYVLDLIRQTSVFQTYEKIIHVIRRYTFIRTTIQILLVLFTAIQTSAVFLIATSFFFISLPFTLLIANATLILTFLRSRGINERNRERMKHQAITVFFPPKNAFRYPCRFFWGTVIEEARREGRICIIVSPYFWKTYGFLGKKGAPYLASRPEGDSILLIRKHYYFTIKKRIFSNPSLKIDHVTELY